MAMPMSPKNEMTAEWNVTDFGAIMGMMMSKQAINRGLDQSRFNGFLGEGDLAHMLNFSEDRAEGLTAFRERRQAKFKGQ